MPPIVETPTTFKVFVLTSTVEIPETVTEPPEIEDTSKFSPKLIVPAVPTVLLSCLIIIPVPDAVIPVSPEPSPINVAVTPLGPLKDVALIIPVMFTLPVPVIDLLNKSRFPPS